MNSPALQRLIDGQAVTQLRHGEGRMATLGSENGVPMLDWVEGAERLLRDGHGLEEVEAEARALLHRGIRHIIWAGMGGSVMTVRVLADLGLFGGAAGIAIYPLDSTDPAALNAIVRHLAASKGLDPSGDLDVSELFGDVLMIAVSMGMTSEEPITHLEWFIGCLEEADLPVPDHALVMTLPDSYLDDFARQHRLPARPLQLDGRTGTPGRMSAPTTRVFLFPAALALLGEGGGPRTLRWVLEEAWRNHDLDLAERDPARHPFVRLAAALADVCVNGRCGLMLGLASGHEAMLPWIEQLIEESLGKGGKGVVVFPDQTENMPADQAGTLRVRVGEPAAPGGAFRLDAPALNHGDARDILAAVATCFLGWQLTVALYGYLEDIVFAGQPAVENYKARSRRLRRNALPLDSALAEGSTARSERAVLILPPGHPAAGPPEDALAALLSEASGRLPYLDLTVNGELPADIMKRVGYWVLEIGNGDLQVPVKVRRAPAAYHATEQSEMDGPPRLVSLRTVCRRHQSLIVGTYSNTLLTAQAVATWQAMNEQGRDCALLVLEGSPEEADETLIEFLGGVHRRMRRHLSARKA